VILVNSLLRIFKDAGRLQLCGGGGGGTDFVGTCGGPSDRKCVLAQNQVKKCMKLYLSKI